MCVYTAHRWINHTMIWLLDINKIKCFACKWSENLQRIQRTPHKWKTHSPAYHKNCISFKCKYHWWIRICLSAIGIFLSQLETIEVWVFEKFGESFEVTSHGSSKTITTPATGTCYRFEMKLFWFMISKKSEIDSNVQRGDKRTSTDLFREKLTIGPNKNF